MNAIFPLEDGMEEPEHLLGFYTSGVGQSFLKNRDVIVQD